MLYRHGEIKCVDFTISENRAFSNFEFKLDPERKFSGMEIHHESGKIVVVSQNGFEKSREGLKDCMTFDPSTIVKKSPISKVVVFLDILELDLHKCKFRPIFDRAFKISSNVDSTNSPPKLNLSSSTKKGYPLIFLVVCGQCSQALTLILKKKELVPAASLTIRDTVVSYSLTSESLTLLNRNGCIKIM